MARFYVLRGKKVFWNLVLIVVVVLALVYVFRGDDELGPQEAITTEDISTSDLVLVEPVTVRAIPTKFSEYKLERERIRSRQIELMQEAVYNTQFPAAQKTEAQGQLHNLIERMSRETEIENLLKAKGYLDGLVILDKEAITVVVPVTLTREEAAKIGELVQRMTGIGLDAITIVDELIGI
ncbi:MAG: SpoIIIAH-like family protein [Firmicutes bacterium]|nr:SpoIIIAH-like family protein [Bacillota bacterium]